ncbi:Glycosyl transferase family protein [Burkholderia gladioli]|uniref:Glycosyl transferase family protein n=2 Tax=Burkholderia gladioli TaxID=28095 RepID=F2LF91_BURGS|nr:glycosyltransferase family A protein [Burkholderia gladioli]AEA60678.1 glycosyl transferase family protein [Burkholderia gladioli BSR3]MBW5288366.1 glycosyltransferase family 2 protein [Burkholderia gladioli]CAG9222019.1 Glycosyl transferase family protein [Burkholderia gladioli]
MQMKKYVIVATKGRADECRELLSLLAGQSAPLDAVYVVGAEPPDVEGLQAHPLASRTRLTVCLSPAQGLTRQRNHGVERLLADIDTDAPGAQDWFVVFFDDDYRPAADWAACCEQVFAENREIVALTGRVLADGIMGAGLTEQQARDYLCGAIPPASHWASGDTQREMQSVYGCNMAIAGRAMRSFRFDENLPLYAWQEDRDFTGLIKRIGKVVYDPRCVGVHLGTKRGRTSGIRMGYSQIANPLYLYRKGTMSRRVALRFIVRNVLANVLKSLLRIPFVDYPGRLHGNVIGFWDVVRGKIHPLRVLQIGAK